MSATIIAGNKIEFQVDGVYQSLYAAKKYLLDHGYCSGSLCGPLPVGFARGKEWPFAQKWKNMSSDEKKFCSGIMNGGWREGPVLLTFYDGHQPKLPMSSDTLQQSK